MSEEQYMVFTVKGASGDWEWIDAYPTQAEAQADYDNRIKMLEQNQKDGYNQMDVIMMVKVLNGKW